MNTESKYLKVRLIDGTVTEVRQKKPFEGVFVTKNGEELNIFDLDFSPEENSRKVTFMGANPLSEAFEAIVSGAELQKQIAMQADADERAYWREIRGDIFLELLRKGWATSITKIADATDIAVQSLAKDDKEMFKNGKENQV